MNHKTLLFFNINLLSLSLWLPWVFHSKCAVNKWLHFKDSIINKTAVKLWCIKNLFVGTGFTFWMCGCIADVGRSHIFMQRTCRAIWKGSFWLWTSKSKLGKIICRSSNYCSPEISALQLSYSRAAYELVLYHGFLIHLLKSCCFTVTIQW